MQSSERASTPKMLNESFPNAKTMNVKCQSIIQHWGVIWSNLFLMIKSFNNTILTKTKWSYSNLSFQLPHPSIHISSFNIKLFPDYYEKQLHIRYNNPNLPKPHGQSVIEKYCMNQYLKSIPMKTSLPQGSDEVKSRHEKIPTYYMYNYGITVVNGIKYEDIVFTLHIPCMCAWEREEFPIISSTFSMLIPHEIQISSNTFLWDIFLDNLNKIFFEFQLKHCENSNGESYQSLISALTTCINHFDEYLLALTIPQKKKEMIQLPFDPSHEFIQKLIANHIISHYTLIVSDIPFYSQFIYDLICPLDSANLFNQPNTQPSCQRVISLPNPFFRTICVTSFTEEQYFLLPYPFCVIDPINQTVGRSSTQSILRYFIQRQNHFISLASKKLSITQFVPTIKIVPKLFDPPLTSLISPYTTITNDLLKKKEYNTIKALLLQFLDSCAMKSHFISEILIKLHISEESDRLLSPSIVFELEKQMNCDVEGLKVILGSYKFSEPYFVGMVMDGIEKFV